MQHSMVDLQYCGDCGTDLSEYDLRDLPDGQHGVACPECGRDVYCGECGNLTHPNPPEE